jgi:hypothetical protein
LHVEEHTDGDIASGTQIAYSSAYQELPQTPARLTWTIPATTLRAGRGYGFRLVWDPSKCRYGRQTTWAHNSATVNGGRSRCTVGPPAQPSRHAVLKRMWHVTGVNDRQPACASSQASWAFDASMPEGWLVTNSTNSYVLSATAWQSAPSPATACGQTAANAGAQVVLWRSSPGMPPSYYDYVCMWPQYGPLQSQPADPLQPPSHSLEDGWYYGIPWQSDSTGSPRDAYLKLDTIDYSALIARHAPVLLYDSAEAFSAVSPGAMTDFHDATSLLMDDSNSIKDSDSARFAIADDRYVDPYPGSLSKLNLEFLGSNYADPPTNGWNDGMPASASDFISVRGNADDGLYDDDARHMEGQGDYANRAYARVAYGADGRLWIQYWLFYYFNSLSPVHEGDWEMVQVGVNHATHQPELAVYAQHTQGERCPWSLVEKTGDQPLVYVGEGSHASYFEPIPDVADGLRGPPQAPSVDPITATNPSWAGWIGKWGESDTSPAGPGHGGNANKRDPGRWASDPGLGDCG